MKSQGDGPLSVSTGSTGARPSPSRDEAERSLSEILGGARRIANGTGWFEIIELPNEVYAFWEPGHVEEVNAFLIVGTERDVLYDTGMGIASIGRALADLRRAEGWPERELMVINSHNHLDHNGGNTDFDEAWIIEDEWAIRKLTEGIPSDGRFVGYWDQLKDHAGVEAPASFDPTTFRIPPFARENIRFLADGDSVDLGNRRFRVIHTTSHSPDGLALYDEENHILFGGDTFIGDEFLIRDLDLLEQDLVIASDLDVEWHYCSHGPQLIEVMRSGYHLTIIRRMIDGERTESETTFVGDTFPIYELDGIAVILAPEFLTY
jgi:glyoxylase-like metal-dependent hydrolase (beta-lactamase superfamily II)